jgi:hypothetical protein
MKSSQIVQLIEKSFQFLASLKLAVIVIVALGVISAVGTIYEARYDAAYAQKVVYHSSAMYFVLALLCVNLFNVMIDRLPWKAHHSGFILAHIGIITLILGSLVTRLYGLDGSMAIDVGQSNRYVMLPNTEFSVYSSFGSGSWELLHKEKTDFFARPPNKYSKPFQLGDNKVHIKDYLHYARYEQSIVASDDKKDAPAFRIQLQNANVNMTQWLKRDYKNPSDVLDLGPARVIAQEVPYVYTTGNAVVLQAIPNSDSFNYSVYTQSKGGLTKKGKATTGDVIDLGWMGLQMRVLKYMPQAREDIKFTKLERPLGPFVTSALLVEFNGKDYWLALNSNNRIFTNNAVYMISFNNQRYDVGFAITLEKFNVGRYQGTMRAASYASDVQAEGFGPAHISMNNPLKHKGYTFYQASFQEDERGQATASILSVNRDPGRWIKYLGSFLIVLGSVVMFYFKRYRLKIFSKLQEVTK